MSPELLGALASASPSGAILIAWYLFSRKQSEGFARLYDRLDKHLSESNNLLREALGRDKS